MMFDGLASSANPHQERAHQGAGRGLAQARARVSRRTDHRRGGLPSYEVATWYGLWAPKGTPKEAVDRHAERDWRRRSTSDELQKAWNGLGAETPDLCGDAFGKFVGSEIKRWAEVVKSSGAKLD